MAPFSAHAASIKGTGVETFLDGKDISGSGVFEPDRFYFDVAARIIERQRENGPMFLHVYLTANHFPYNSVFRPDLTPADSAPRSGQCDAGGRRISAPPGNDRSATIQTFLERLKHDFPAERFLIVRFGDHQPDFAKLVVERGIDVTDSAAADGLRSTLLQYLFCMGAINFRPVELSSALDPLDAPYLPLVVQEAAGLPLDPTFAEQNRIWIAATDCSMAAPAAPRRGGSIDC